MAAATASLPLFLLMRLSLSARRLDDFAALLVGFPDFTIFGAALVLALALGVSVCKASNNIALRRIEIARLSDA